ncbi:endonuclease/exonuclease/phosphatase family protein [Azohydromonas caseinilytica]|uniref:Endonuclease/exonuclease/phosphatase family protein n=1 Tax=Azohydromonas caseinilytica TaxID=2728836 RepID=A0A848FFM8_9BURK|nr:endonuclease/exonuclease/phosphatase family protein [Azohydromonas caseinilytica]NML17946.1 endonuclease/exonuclease/phosphatase family protein [Azohydromonas caseinilytica]
MSSVRIGTWNLGRSGAFHRTRIARQLELLRQYNADVWVLTEAHDANVPPGGHVVSSSCNSDFHHTGEHRVVLWSRYPLSQIATEDPVSTVAARLEVPGMDLPLLVYGTVISHAHGGVVQRQALSWQRHHEAVQRQRAEWLRLRQNLPDHAMCVAGDFNTNLDEAARYGAADPRHSILQGLADAGMACLTSDALRRTLAQPGDRAGVDHVCFSSDMDGLSSQIEAWPATIDGQRLSERGGILVELAWRRASNGQPRLPHP